MQGTGRPKGRQENRQTEKKRKVVEVDMKYTATIIAARPPVPGRSWSRC